jgi:CpeT protein
MRFWLQNRHIISSRRTPHRSAASVAAFILVAGLGGCASTAKRDSTMQADVGDPAAEVAVLMAGQYDSRDQSATDGGYYAISLAMIPIWPQRTDGHWLYVEQAIADTADKPYRQRVYRVSNSADGAVLSAVYTIDRPERFVQGWRNGALNGLSEAMLQPRAGCTVSLRAEGGAWRGATTDKHCASDLRGAAYATAEVRLDGASMHSWDRGYDASGKQVWGATAGPYRFVKRTPVP